MTKIVTRDGWKSSFGKRGLTSEGANSITAGCESAKSGQFQVVFSAASLGDGPWKRLIDVAQHYDLRFEIVLLARKYDLKQWLEALRGGAFDVPNVLCDLPKAAEAAQRAFGGVYLKCFRPRPESASS